MSRRMTWLFTALTICGATARGESGRLIVRVLDGGTGRVIPARLALRAGDGTYPGDRLGLDAGHWPGIEAKAVFIAGERAFDLPEGEATIVAAHGPGYHVATRRVRVTAGATTAAELTLDRVLDLRRLGWVGGDAHVHMIHGEAQRPTDYEDVATTCRANGLDWAYVNQEYVGAGTLDRAGYEAACRRASTDDFRLLLGGERPKSLLGHNALIGVPDSFTIPDDPPYHRAAREIHARGGVLFPVHPLRYFPGKRYQGEWLDFPGNNLARELIFDAYLGPSFDGVSVLSDEPADPVAHRLWWNLLNRGFFVPALADSDACFDRPVLGKNVPGFWTTYLHIGPGAEVDHATLAEAVRAGRTMATTGPLLLFRIDGQVSGATLPPDGRPHAVEIEAHHPHHNWSLATRDPKRDVPVGIARVELIRDGVVIKTWEPGTPEARLSWSVAPDKPGWYAARAFGTDGQWQVALASPIYFADRPAARKREPLAVTVRGRIYDFGTGEERPGRVEVRRGEAVLARFEARGQFRAKVPLDAEVVVDAPGARPIRTGLLLDYGPVHHFLWSLESADLGRPETFDRFESLVRRVDLEFPLGHRMPGCYLAADLRGDLTFQSARVLDGPDRPTTGSIAPAAVLLDKEQVGPGDRIAVAAIFRDERPDGAASGGRLVVEGRAYDPARPTGFTPLKSFGSVEANWADASELGRGYRLITGSLTVPAWAQPGPAGAIEIGARARLADRDGGHLGLLVPMGPTRRALSLSSGWPTMPISWHDHNYGVGPLRVCGKAGRLGQPRADYRRLRLAIGTDAGDFELYPVGDATGCPDADDAIFVDRFPDQVLADESHLAERAPIRPQPQVDWREVPLNDATGR